MSKIEAKEKVKNQATTNLPSYQAPRLTTVLTLTLLMLLALGCTTQPTPIPTHRAQASPEPAMRLSTELPKPFNAPTPTAVATPLPAPPTPTPVPSSRIFTGPVPVSGIPLPTYVVSPPTVSPTRIAQAATR